MMNIEERIAKLEEEVAELKRGLGARPNINIDKLEEIIRVLGNVTLEYRAISKAIDTSNELVPVDTVILPAHIIFEK